MVTIWGLPVLEKWLGGWQYVFLVLAPGPIIGAGVMLYLRKLPEAERLAGGKR